MSPVRWRSRQESAGSWSTLTVQAFSRSGVAWSWGGRSMVKLPYSSVVANAKLSNWLLGVRSLLQVTATLAPDQKKKNTTHQSSSPNGKMKNKWCRCANWIFESKCVNWIFLATLKIVSKHRCNLSKL